MFLLMFFRFTFVVFWTCHCLAVAEDGSLSMVNDDRDTIVMPCKELRGSCSSWQTPDHFPSQSLHHARDNVNPNSKQWTTMQKLMPIVVGVVLTIVFIVLFLLYRRRVSSKQRKGPWTEGNARGPRRFFGLLPDVRKVREASRAGSWTIDQYNNYNDIETVRSPDPRGYRSGHVRLSSSPPPLDPRVTSSGKSWYGSSTKSVPALWQNLQVVRKLQDLVPTPWKRKPIPIKSQAAKVGFRVDSFDVNSQASPLRRSGRGASPGIAGPSRLELVTSPGGGQKDEDDSDSDSGLGESEVDEEQVLLIRPEPIPNGEDVVLISSSPGVNFSVESGDTRPAHGSRQATPPAPIQSQQSSPNHLSRPSQELLDAYANLPPAPNYPAPLPPVLSKPTHSHTPSSESMRSYAAPSSLNQPPRQNHGQINPPTRATQPSTHISRPSTESLRRAPAHVRRPSAGNISPPSSLRLPSEDTGRVPRPTHRPSHSMDNPEITSHPYLSTENLAHPHPQTDTHKYPSESFMPPQTDNLTLYPDAVRDFGSARKSSSRNTRSDSIPTTRGPRPPLGRPARTGGHETSRQ